MAFHFFYHAGPLDLLRHFVGPALPELLARRLFDRFFYISYSLGGPHLRIRFRLDEGDGSELARRLGERAERLCAERPSAADLDVEAIRRHSAAILATAPEPGELVYPDNSFLPFPFEPEVARYGGPGLLAHSLDFFCLSSAVTLEAATEKPERTRAQRWALAMRILLGQAWAFAEDGAELHALLGYRLPVGDAAVDAVFGKADAAFERNREHYLALLQWEIAAQEVPPPAGGLAGWPLRALLAEGARGLSWRTSARAGAASTQTRWDIATSQLHMTANRLGHPPLEELYLLRILRRAAEEIAGTEPAAWEASLAAQAERLGDTARRAAPLGELIAAMHASYGRFRPEYPPAERPQPVAPIF